LVSVQNLVFALYIFAYSTVWVSPVRNGFWTFGVKNFGISGSEQSWVLTPDYEEIFGFVMVLLSKRDPLA
jgi:hypothetical protein